MNTNNRKNCINLDVPYKACQDCKGFAGANDQLDDKGEDWVSTRGVCILNTSGEINKFTYLPGDIIYVDADEEICGAFDEFNSEIKDDTQYPGFYNDWKELDSLSFKELQKDKIKFMSGLYQNISGNTKLKVSKVRQEKIITLNECKTLKDGKSTLLTYGKDHKYNETWLKNVEKLTDCRKLIPLLCNCLEATFMIIYEKDNEKHYVNAQVFINDVSFVAHSKALFI